MPMSRLFALALAAAAFVLPSCGSESRPEASSDAVDAAAARARFDAHIPEGPVQNFALPAKVSVRVDGEKMASLGDEVELTVLRAKGPNGEGILTVGADQGLETADGWRLEVFFNLVNFGEDGTYSVDPPPATGGKPKLANNAYVVLVRGATAAEVEAGRYETATKACTVEIAARGLSGSARCPALTDTAGKAVSLSFTWKAAGKARSLLPGEPAPIEPSS